MIGEILQVSSRGHDSQALEARKHSKAYTNTKNNVVVPMRSTAAQIIGTCWEENFSQGRERDIFSVPFSRPDNFLEIPKPIAVSMRRMAVIGQQFSTQGNNV